MKKFDITKLLKKKSIAVAGITVAAVAIVLSSGTDNVGESQDNLTDLNSGYSDSDSGFTRVGEGLQTPQNTLTPDNSSSENSHVSDNADTLPDNSYTADNPTDASSVADSSDTSNGTYVSDNQNAVSPTDSNPDAESSLSAENTGNSADNNLEISDNKVSVTDNSLSSESSTENSTTQASSESSTVSGINVESFTFSEDSRIPWPVRGEILIGYSPDHAVYHETLSQFKINPAILISCEEGTSILAGVPGIVTAVYEDAWHGHMVTIDVGDGYSFTYGQLNETTLKNGDILESGDLIGTVAATTKYYSIEGNHLYFQIKYEDQSLDPSLFME